MEFLNYERAAELWTKIDIALQQKQDKLVGTQDQIVGFDAAGNTSAHTMAVPGGIATLDSDGMLAEAQRPLLAGIRGGSNPNLLDNWYFLDPINQRAQTEYASTAPAYFIDRWKFHSHGGAYNTTTGQLTMHKNDWSGIIQCYENPQWLIGKTVTLSFLYSASIPTAIQIAGVVNGRAQAIAQVNVAPHSVEELYTVSGLVPEGTTALNVQLFNSSNKSEAESGIATLLAAKLELGPFQTLAHREGNAWVLNAPLPDRTLELAKCQRYQLPLQDRPGNYGGAVGYGFCASKDYARICIPTPVTMRGNPALTYLAGNLTSAPLVVYDCEGGHTVDLPNRAQGNYNNQIYILFHASSGALSGNRPCTFRIAGTGILMLDANL